jgi:hypothetical protein
MRIPYTIMVCALLAGCPTPPNTEITPMEAQQLYSHLNDEMKYCHVVKYNLPDTQICAIECLGTRGYNGFASSVEVDCQYYGHRVVRHTYGDGGEDPYADVSK